MKIEAWLGDCLDRMKEIPDGSISMILADPPYGTLAYKWDSVIPLHLMWGQVKRIVKPTSPIVLFASQPFTSVLVSSNLKDFRYQWVWQKSRPANFPQAKRQPMKYHEDIVVFGVKSPIYYPQMVKGDKVRTKGTNAGYRGFHKGLDRPDYLEKEYRDFYPSSIQSFPHHNAGLIHPTQKPVALMEYLIKTYTLEGETVLDFTAGSFTTGVACINTDRDFIGIEKNDTYFKLGVDRMQKHIYDSGKQVELIVKEGV